MAGQDVTVHRLDRDEVGYYYDAATTPRLVVDPGETVVFQTWDARAGALLDRPVNEPFELPLPTPGKGNPLTGPVAVIGARPGDALVVTIAAIRCDPLGWCGGHAHVGPLPPGRVPRPVGRVCAHDEEFVYFSEDIRVPLRPMIGCIGTAPSGPPQSAGLPGNWGGNLDHPIICAGARVLLPVFTDGGLLYIGDVHATQGDGELSGVGLEIPAEVEVTIDLEKSRKLRWPWAVTADSVAVMTTAMEFNDARREAVEEMTKVLERQLGLETADAVALISITGDLRIGQAYGGMEMTLRLEMPKDLGITPP